jgi:hypothetical protein
MAYEATHEPGRSPSRPGGRVGGYQIIFTVDDKAQVVHFSDIGPRGHVYRPF